MTAGYCQGRTTEEGAKEVLTQDELMQAISRLDELATESGIDGALATLGLEWPWVHLFAMRRTRMLGPFRGLTQDPAVYDALAIVWLDALAVGLVASSDTSSEPAERLNTVTSAADKTDE